MATIKRKIVFEDDHDPDMSWLDQWNTPETYEGNEVLACPMHPYARVVKRRTRWKCEQCGYRADPLTFREYMETVGNPDNHRMLEMVVYEMSPADDDWRLVDSLGNIDMFAETVADLGTFYYRRDIKDPYLRSLARDAKIPFAPRKRRAA